ncbi:MAG: hypothetical protein OEW11_05720 [Nitrospirota bacterium]|nr:hypothetical protein [Nitrospirota bacterium]
MRTLKRHIACSCLTTLLVFLGVTSAHAAQPYELGDGVHDMVSLSANKLALKRNRELLRNMARFVGHHLALDLSSLLAPSGGRGAAPDTMDGAAVMTSPLDMALSLSELTPDRQPPADTRLTVNSDRIRLTFRIRW